MKTRFLLTVCLGIFGAHKFYEGNKKVGLIYFFTLGLFLVGWIADSLSMGFRGRDAFFSNTANDTLTSDGSDVNRITRLVGCIPLVVVLFSAGSDKTQTSQDIASAAPELAKDHAFCAGYIGSLAPGLAERRHCAMEDDNSVLLCQKLAFEGLIRSKSFAVYEDQIAIGYRLGRIASSGSTEDLVDATKKCDRLLEIIIAQMKKQSESRN